MGMLRLLTVPFPGEPGGPPCSVCPLAPSGAVPFRPPFPGVFWAPPPFGVSLVPGGSAGRSLWAGPPSGKPPLWVLPNLPWGLCLPALGPLCLGGPSVSGPPCGVGPVPSPLSLRHRSLHLRGCQRPRSGTVRLGGGLGTPPGSAPSVRHCRSRCPPGPGSCVIAHIGLGSSS